MLHEILLSLSGHPSPLLRNDYTDPKAQSIISPPERELLKTAGHLSDLHCKLISYTAQISTSHSSVICRAVSTSINSLYLDAFQRKVLEVEDSVLRKDASLVGAYNIVPLTAVMGEFSDWTRRMEWLWDLVQFIDKQNEGSPCRGAHLINRLRAELQTGYTDIGEAALSLVRVAETAWLKQVSAWVLYGEFAMALTQQADEVIRNRWRRADNLAYEKRYGLNNVMVKEGEVAAVLTKTWALLSSMQGQHADEDEGLEIARDLLRLNLSKTKTPTPKKPKAGANNEQPGAIVNTPFRNLLFSVPVVLTSQFPPPLDLFLTISDVQTYTSINSYLLSIRRSHLHLTDLWKITSLRRHHPPPPRPPYSTTKGGVARTRVLRERWSARSSTMRGTWSTSSAAIFFLAETETYLQIEVVESLWDDFLGWLTGKSEHNGHYNAPSHNNQSSDVNNSVTENDSNSVQDSPKETQNSSPAHHDPQTLAIAHRLYLRTLSRRLLLTQPSFTNALYDLLVHIDHLVALVHRLHGIWTSMDLEADEGVVDAFSDLVTEEKDVRSNIRDIERQVKSGIENVISVLRGLSMDSAFMAELEDGDRGDSDDDDDAGVADEMLGEGGGYIPRRTGGIDRLLMKLDFGGWFDAGKVGAGDGEDDDGF
ncbi:hypothetical protein ABKA04_009211 [Annulohypoxylon sp. FPYF3050]